MKKRYSTLAIALLFSMAAFAQKDEFKTLKKIYEKDQPSSKDLMKYKEAVTAATPLVAASNEEDMLYLNFYKSNIPFLEMSEAMSKPENQANPQNALKYFTPQKITDFAKNAAAVLAYEEKAGKSELSSKIKQLVNSYKPQLLSYAIGLVDQEKFTDASDILYSIYLLDNSEADKLYYAANNSVNAKDYTKALEYYKKLIELNFSGEKTNYMAVNKASDVVEYFESKAKRDQSVKMGIHENPTEEKEPSKRGIIYKTLAEILIELDRVEEAKVAIIEARKVNPDDTSLIIAEANVYLKTNDMDTYAKLINEVLVKDPNNADLVYNLGVVSSQNKDIVNAKKYYLRAIEIDPNYANAYFNLSAVRIDEAELLLDQMNKLGTTAADNKKYDVLKTKREEILKDVVTLLEKTTSLDPKNKPAKEVLLSVYKALEMKEKTKALQAELDK